MKAYGEIQLTVASPPQSFTEPVTVNEFKSFMRLPITSPTEDALEDSFILSAIAGARQALEIEIGFDLIQKQWDLHLDLLLGYDAIAGAAYPLRFNAVYNIGIGYEIPLRYPLQSVDRFTNTDNSGVTATLTEGTDYIVDLNRSLVCPPWGKVWPFFTPYPTSAVFIRYTSGYPETHPFWFNVGQMVKQFIRVLASEWWTYRVPFEPGRVSAEHPHMLDYIARNVARPRVH
jgi:hypothetical protein